jgi:hypothetical protein
VNSNEKLLSNLEMTRSSGTESSPRNLRDGLTIRKKRTEARKNRIYESSFEIPSFIRERTFTSMLLPAIVDSIGNHFIKVGIGIAIIISAFGYLIEKIKH